LYNNSGGGIRNSELKTFDDSRIDPKKVACKKEKKHLSAAATIPWNPCWNPTWNPRNPETTSRQEEIFVQCCTSIGSGCCCLAVGHQVIKSLLTAAFLNGAEFLSTMIR
jgi:hypothetical protein